MATQLPALEIVEIKPDEIIETNAPEVLNPADEPQLNTPTNTPTTALGTNEGTVVEKTNDERGHACDTMLYLDRAVAYAKFYGGQIVAAIRRGIQAALAALGISPGSNALIQFLKQIKRAADEITELLQEIQDFLNAFITAVAKIKALIDYILSLPDRLIALFINCIKEAYAELSAAFLDVVNVGSDSENSESIISAAKDAYASVSTSINTVTQVAATAAALPATAVAALTSGSTSPAEQDKIVNEFYSSYDQTKTYSTA